MSEFPGEVDDSLDIRLEVLLEFRLEDLLYIITFLENVTFLLCEPVTYVGRKSQKLSVASVQI